MHMRSEHQKIKNVREKVLQLQRELKDKNNTEQQLRVECSKMNRSTNRYE